MKNIIPILSKRTKLSLDVIKNILTLLEDGSTIPFIARYRKELTNGASDEVLREFEEIYSYILKLEERKDEVSRLIGERSILTESLKKQISEADTLVKLEDIYRPFKEKKNTRASVAIANGLEPLANLLQRATLSRDEFEKEAKRYINSKVKTIKDVIKGSQDIIAEKFSDREKQRDIIRIQMQDYGIIEVKSGKNFEEGGVYKQYKSHNEKLSFMPSHRFLAVNRGVNEKQLSLKIDIDIDRVKRNIERTLPRDSKGSKEYLLESYYDSLKRLLMPSIQRETLSQLKQKADKKAIATFGKNLTQLLLTPPLGKRVLLGVDPGFRTGCKLALLSEQGECLDYGVIYPSSYDKSKQTVMEFAKKYHIKAVAIGNGTGSKETQDFFAKLNSEIDSALPFTVVSESGASIYSASKLANEEYPNIDVTIRGAISIAARVQDPMAAFVKIDPKSLGIGQYQHDVDQKLLTKKLQDTIEDLVNRVGVDVNQASYSLLSFVAGITAKLAKSIVTHRQKNGVFKTKKELLKVKGMGAKSFEQSAGFIRIRESKNILDNTGVHPESYEIANRILRGESIDDLSVGEETLKDIKKELEKPGFDIREELPPIVFKQGLSDISMLGEGSIVSGVVRSITDFGAFVDIGIKNDGMIHISKMSHKRINHPLEILNINQHLAEIRVISIDKDKGRVGLSLI